MKLRELAARFRANTTSSVVELDVAGGRRVVTHAKLGWLADRRARQLLEAGVRPGHVIGMHAANSIDWVCWDLAAISVGAVMQVFPTEAPLGDPQEAIKNYDLAALITDRPGEQPSPWVVAIDADELGSVRGEAASTATEDLHSLVYSSGTSGGLKGLRISTKGTEYVVGRFLDFFDIGPDDSHLIFLPLANFQQRLSVYCCLWTGADIVLSPYQRLFASMPSERPTFVIAPPVVYDTIIQLFRKAGDGAPLNKFLGGRIRFLITGMAAIRRSTMDAFWNAGVSLLEAYGMTECGMIAWNTSDAHKPGTVGKLIDPNSVEFGADGELLIRRAAPLSLGYFDTPPGFVDETFHADGAIASGDYGRLDPDGYLTLQGRRKDLIILDNGIKIHPAETERMFAGLAGIADIVVVPTGRGNRLGAIVTPVAASDPVQRSTIVQAIDRANGALEVHHQIASVLFTDQPLQSDQRFRTENMKLSRGAATSYFAENSAERVAVKATGGAGSA